MGGKTIELINYFYGVIFSVAIHYVWDFYEKKLRRRINPQPVVTGYKVRTILRT